MRALFFLLLTLSITKFYCQEIVKGKIVDKNENPISYANIGMLNKEMGTVSNINGFFELFLDKKTITDNDSLKISCLGFYSKIILIKDFINNKSIVLDVKTEKLDEVVIISSREKEYTVGNSKTSTKRSVNFSITNKKNQNLGAEIGKKFNLKKGKNNYLKEFMFFISNNNFDDIIFRINIYTIKKNKPFQKINTENIIIEVSNSKKGWITTDLSPYDIITTDDIIISVEWIDYLGEKGSKLSLPIIIPSLFANHYYKYGSQSKWKKYNNISSAMKLVFEN